MAFARGIRLQIPHFAQRTRDYAPRGMLKAAYRFIFHSYLHILMMPPRTDYVRGGILFALARFPLQLCSKASAFYLCVI